MLVLDTNIISELMRPQPSPIVLHWLDQQPRQTCWLTSITLAEIYAGIAALPDGKRKINLHLLAQEIFAEEFADRILAFDHIAAWHYGSVVAKRTKLGQPISIADAQIAAMCLAHATDQTNAQALVFATRNVKDFANIGLTLINPWQLEQI